MVHTRARQRIRQRRRRHRGTYANITVICLPESNRLWMRECLCGLFVLRACVRIATSALVSFRYVSCMDTCRMSDVTQHTQHTIYKHTHTRNTTRHASVPIRLCVALSCLSVRLAALALLITSTSLTCMLFVCVCDAHSFAWILLIIAAAQFSRFSEEFFVCVCVSSFGANWIPLYRDYMSSGV